MKNSFALFLVSWGSLALGQEHVSEIITPTSPASSVIGLQATEILSPKSAKALETALYSNFVSGGAPAIADDFALEFMPYWAADHGLSAAAYLFPSVKDQLVRNSSFSIASTQNFVLGNGTPTNALGFGYRTSLFFPSSTDKGLVHDFTVELDGYHTLRSNIAASMEARIDDLPSKTRVLEETKVAVEAGLRKAYPRIQNKDVNRISGRIISKMKREKFDEGNKRAFLEILYAVAADEAPGKDVVEEFDEYLNQRQGFSIDAAFATMVSFPTNDFNLSYSPRTSVWVTPSYRLENDQVDFLKFLGVLRRDWYQQGYYETYFPDVEQFKYNTDLGAGLALDFKRFSLQGEVIRRSTLAEVQAGVDASGNSLYRKEGAISVQYIGTFSFRISDQVVVAYNLGSKFNFATLGNSLFSLLSLNLGFGDPGENLNDGTD